jgi:hypothetical protein
MSQLKNQIQYLEKENSHNQEVNLELNKKIKAIHK